MVLVGTWVYCWKAGAVTSTMATLRYSTQQRLHLLIFFGLFAIIFCLASDDNVIGYSCGFVVFDFLNRGAQSSTASVHYCFRRARREAHKIATNAKILMCSKQQPHSKLPYNSPAIHSANAPLNDNQIQQLKAQGFTQSLAESLNHVKQHFPLRIWVVDNSSSMNAKDGHRIVSDRVAPTGDTVRMVPCTRWAELSSCVEYHMRLAALIEAPTRFRLLNPSTRETSPSKSVFSIGERQTYSSASDRFPKRRKP